MEEKRNSYIGSVRFFKNLILVAVLIMIAVPTVFAVCYHHKSADLQKTVTKLSQEIKGEKKEKDSNKDSATQQAEPIDYQSLYPDFYAPQKYGATERVEKTAFLTFDDGPSERTDEVLDILAEKGVKATFYVIGQSSEENFQRMRDIVAQGHTLGMHSYCHNYEKIYASVEDYLADMYQIFTQIKEATGQTPTAFRFPGGSLNAYNGALYREMISEMMRRGFVPCDWNISSGDATGESMSASAITQNILGQSGDKIRCFILYHDSEPKTSSVGSLSDVIDGLQEQGFKLEAITEKTMPVLFGYSE